MNNNSKLFQFSKPIIKSINYDIVTPPPSTDNSSIHSHIHRNVYKADGKNEAYIDLIVELGLDERSNNPPFKMRIVVSSAFKWEEQIEESIISNFLQTEGSKLLLDYTRPIISNITSNSIGQFDIPFIDFANANN